MFLRSLLFCFLIQMCLMAAPRVVVFDFGGVMTGEPKREAMVHFLCQAFGLSKEEFRELNQKKREALRLEKTDLEFWQALAQQRGVALPEDWPMQFRAMTKVAMNPTPEMFELVEQLKVEGIQVALFSNIDQRLAGFVRDVGLYEPFEPCILSYEIGAEKPLPKAYKTLLSILGLSAEEVVFFDDKLENVDAAKGQGIDAILFESPKQVKQELKQRGLLKF